MLNKCFLLFLLCSTLSMALPTVSLATEPLTGFKLEGVRWTYQENSFLMSGILLKPPGSGPFPAVLISHGLGGSAESFGMSKAREMVQWGLVCIACDYTHARGPGARGPDANADRATFGASESNLRRASKCLEILASLPEVDARRICAYGHSMGGFVTIGLTAKNPEGLLAAAISGSGIAPRSGFAAPSADVAAKTKTPMLMIHGGNDSVVRPDQSLALKELLDAHKVPNARHVFDGVNHPVDQQKAPETYELIKGWFTQHGVWGTPSESPTNAQVSQTAPIIQPSSQQAPPRERLGNRPRDQKPSWMMPKIAGPHLHYESFASQRVGEPVSYVIYLPPDYETSSQRRYPVVYWLHGIGGSQQGLPEMSRRLTAAIEAKKAPAMLVVFVNGMIRSSYVDSKDGKTPVESVALNELIPHIDTTYRTIARREGRMIEGFSMGGAGAAKWGLRHPELFGAISILDGALHTDPATGRLASSFDSIYGGDQQYYDAHDPWKLAESQADKLKGRTSIRIVTRTAGLGETNRKYHDHLTNLGLTCELDTIADAPHSPNPLYVGLGDKNWEFYTRAFQAVTTQ